MPLAFCCILAIPLSGTNEELKGRKSHESNMHKKAVCLLALLIFCLNLVCSIGDETYTVEIKDGVRYVNNHAPLWGDEPKITLGLVQKIGEKDTTDENYLLFRPTDIVVDADGNIYVLDTGNFRIQKYDSKGKYLATIGRQGQGPGEFLNPYCMDIDRDSNIYVADRENRRVQIFTSSGMYAGSIRIQDTFTSLRLLYTGELVINPLKSAYKDSRPALISIINKNYDLIREFGDFITHKDPIIWSGINSTCLDIDKNNNIYVCFMSNNRIDKYSFNGKCEFRTNHPLNYKIINQMNKVEENFVPQTTSVTHSMAVDDKERIWVVAYKMQHEELMKKAQENPEKRFELLKQWVELEVFDKNGILLCKMPVEEGPVNIRIFNNHLYVINFTDMYVSEYKIVDM